MVVQLRKSIAKKLLGIVRHSEEYLYEITKITRSLLLNIVR